MKYGMEEWDQYGGWKGLQADASGFFRLERIKGRWWLVTPEGNAFVSTGISHVDYKEDYSPEFVRWTVETLKSWGFNTIGWSQDSKRRDFREGNTPPTRGWGPDEYRYCDMPYMHIIRFVDIEWYSEARFPDVFSREWEENCDALARKDCERVKDDPRLIGYFYTDTPNFPLWKKVCGDAFPEVIAKYYETCAAVIRRYDSHHLILGDRFKADASIPVDDRIVDGMTPEALKAMRDTVDALSVEHMRPANGLDARVREWHEITGKPTLIADFLFLAPTDVLQIPPSAPCYVPDQAMRGEAYVQFMRQAYSNPLVIGAHWCSFGRSQWRRSGLFDGEGRAYEECVGRLRDFNLREMYAVATAACQ